MKHTYTWDLLGLHETVNQFTAKFAFQQCQSCIKTMWFAAQGNYLPLRLWVILESR